MSFMRRFFWSGIQDDEADAYQAHAEEQEREIASRRDAMYRSVIKVQEDVRIFRNAAGQARMLRGSK